MNEKELAESIETTKVQLGLCLISAVGMGHACARLSAHGDLVGALPELRLTVAQAQSLIDFARLAGEVQEIMIGTIEASAFVSAVTQGGE